MNLTFLCLPSLVSAYFCLFDRKESELASLCALFLLLHVILQIFFSFPQNICGLHKETIFLNFKFQIKHMSGHRSL